MAEFQAPQTDSVTIPYRVSCSTCMVKLTQIVSLGSSKDPVLLSTRGNIARDSRGRYFVPSIDAIQFVVFDSSGKYLTAVGRRGQGPGEAIVAISALAVGRGDTIYVLHGQRSVSVYGPSLVHVRSYPVQAPLVATMTASGTVVGSGPIMTRDAIGFDFHIFDSAGNLARSFGRPRRDVRPGERPELPILFALSRNGQDLWGSMDLQYTLARFSLDGRRIFVAQVTGATWVPKGPVVIPNPRGMDPKEYSRQMSAIAAKTFMIVIGEDSAGLIWVYWSSPNGNAPDLRLTLEIVDPKSREIVLSQPLEKRIAFVQGSTLVSASRKDVDGIVSFDISRAQIVRP